MEGAPRYGLLRTGLLSPWECHHRCDSDCPAFVLKIVVTVAHYNWYFGDLVGFDREATQHRFSVSQRNDHMLKCAKGVKAADVAYIGRRWIGTCCRMGMHDSCQSAAGTFHGRF